jgi:hypothetical protein
MTAPRQYRHGLFKRWHYCLFLVLLGLTTTLYAHNDHPLGKQVLDWQPDAPITRTLSLNFDAHAGHFIVAWRPPGGVQTIAGKSCLRGPYFLFDVDDNIAFDTDATITLDFLFHGDDANGFYISYDHVIKPTAKRIEFANNSNGPWHQASVKLERARFANRKYEGTDFSIAALEATHPHHAEQDATVTLCDIKLSIQPNPRPAKPLGNLNLRIVNEKGQMETARIGLYDDEGRAPLPDDSALTVHRYAEKIKQLSLLDSNSLWPGKGRFIFYVDGNYQTQLTAGNYKLVISKGPEYRILQKEFSIEADKNTELLVELKRWIDMPASGWYSGDDHIHIGRPDSSENKMILNFTRAEDIHVANLLQMANVATWHFPQYAFGKPGQFKAGKHTLVAGQESPRSAHLGHTIGLNAQAFHWPEQNYYIYNETAKRIHADGGLFGFAHVALADVFNLDRGLALDVPLGNVDFLEVLQSGLLNTKHLYNFLNLGYKLLPSAGSDYPYIHVAGSERVYVHVPGEFSAKAWFDAWPKGRSFVSNGPVLTFDVNGDQEKGQFEVRHGDSLVINALARVNPDLDEIQKIDLIVHGEVIATSSQKSKNGISLTYKLEPESSLWFALRTLGKGGTVAHSAPVYVLVDGDKRFWKRDAVAEISNDYISALQTLRRSKPKLHDDFELFNTEHYILPKWNAAEAAMDKQISRAIETYENLKKTASE